MKSDNWSLKDLYLDVEGKAGKYGLQCDPCVIEDIIEKHLETLRQKLIEDLCGELLKDGKPFGRHEHIPQITILETINKRFGVDEHEK